MWPQSDSSVAGRTNRPRFGGSEAVTRTRADAVKRARIPADAGGIRTELPYHPIRKGSTMICLMNTCAAIVLAALPGVNAEEQSYDILLTRPWVAGQQVNVIAEGSESRKITAVINGTPQELDNSEIFVELNADASILNVDAEGRPTKIQYTVKRCVMNMNGTSKTVVPKGSVFTAQRHDESQETHFSMNGEALGTNENAALQIIASLSQGGPTENDIFGTSEHQPVGASWDINTDKAIESFHSNTTLPISGADISGRSSLLAVREDKGQPCLMISSRLSIENFVPGFEELPKGFELKRAFLTSMAQGLFPVDSSKLPTQESLNMDLDAILVGALGADQPAAVLQITGSRVASRKFTMLDAGEKVATGSQD